MKVTEEGKQIYAEELMKLLSDKSNDIKIVGQYPDFTLTDGMCSCNFIWEGGKKISLDNKIFQTILSNDSIKNILVGWTWGERLPQLDNKLSMDIKEFVKRNKKAKLQMDTWYRLFDLNKYNKYQ
ncbi:hypothetical protein [Pseudobacillus wudalianchiensis]|uniref:hypothetical protein n=1 Tax=Pseudobacillus wudalianchiensis TaxID=1743143 RepID=UPI0011462F1F|nr:hypothetical protein [Bacillus wudalianchiensis]